MPRRILALSALLLLALMAATSTASAARFNVIFGNAFDVTLCENGCGITLAGSDFALLVNTSATDIGASEFFGAAFEVESSRPDIRLSPFINNPGFPMVAPVHPHEAVGSVSPGPPDNAILLTKLQAGETFRNTAPAQVLAFEIDRPSGAYEGPVQFNVRMIMGGEAADFVITANVHLGPHAIQFLGADRVSSQPLPVATRRGTWGALKAGYR